MKEVVLNGYESEQFLKKYLPTPQSQLVKKIEEIKVSPPLVIKLISPQALHKTEIKGVRIIHTKEQLEKDFSDLIDISKKKNFKLQGIMVQKLYEGESLIIGLKKDPVFGHVMTFGVGGILTELIKDTSTRKCPISETDAKEMLSELKASKLFQNFRGNKLNTSELIKALISVSKIPLKNKNIKELDINPYMLNEKEGIVIDARIILEST